MHRRIVLAHDGSPDAERAAERALELATEDDAAIHALYVLDTTRLPADALSGTEAVVERVEDAVWDRLDAFEAVASERNLTCVCHARRGNPAEEIRRYADEVAADAIVLGYQGHDHERREGSVCRAVRRDADREVIVVGRPRAVQ